MNLGFEEGITGWTPVAAAVRAAAWDVYAEEDTTEGTYCLRFVGDTRPSGSENPGWVRIEFADVFQLAGASSVTYAAWSRQTMSPGPTYGTATYSGAAARLALVWLDAGGNRLGESLGINGRGATEGLFTDFNWMRMEATPPSGATACRIALEARGPDTVELLYDSVGLQVGPTLYGTSVDATFYKPVDRFRGWRNVTQTQTPGAPGSAPTAPSTGVPVIPSAASRQLAVAALPRAGESLVDASGRVSRSFYTWMQAVDKALPSIAAIADEAKAGVDALPPVLGSTDGTVAGIPVGGTRTTVLGQYSVQATSQGTGYVVSLLGDEAMPAATSFYGTDSAGEKGWQPFADALIAGDNITLTTETDGRVTVAAVAAHYTRIAADGSIRAAADNSLRISD